MSSKKLNAGYVFYKMARAMQNQREREAAQVAAHQEKVLTEATGAFLTLVSNGAKFSDAFNELTDSTWWTWERCQLLAARVGFKLP